MPLVSELRAELRALRKEKGLKRTAVAKMKKADVLSQIEELKEMTETTPAHGLRADAYTAPPDRKERSDKGVARKRPGTEEEKALIAKHADMVIEKHRAEMAAAAAAAAPKKKAAPKKGKKAAKKRAAPKKHKATPAELATIHEHVIASIAKNKPMTEEEEQNLRERLEASSGAYLAKRRARKDKGKVRRKPITPEQMAIVDAIVNRKVSETMGEAKFRPAKLASAQDAARAERLAKGSEEMLARMAHLRELKKKKRENK